MNNRRIVDEIRWRIVGVQPSMRFIIPVKNLSRKEALRKLAEMMQLYREEIEIEE